MAASADTPVYRGMTRAEVDAGYNNRAAFTDSDDWIAGWSRRSEPVRSRAGVRLDLRYAGAPRALFDYFPCGVPNAPLFMFFHGGYWHRNHKDMFGFAAEGPLAAGLNVANVGYTLAPEARVSEIVGEAYTATDYLAAHASELGYDPGRIIVGGWSAGAHLAAMLLDHPATAGGLLISGLYDLEPVLVCDVNDVIGLTDDEAERLSPMKTMSTGSIPLCVAYGDRELPEFQRQSIDFAAVCAGLGYPVEALPAPGHHHFSILDELSAPNGILVNALRKLIA